MENLLILGAGGLGKMVREVAKSTNNYEQMHFLDDALRGEHIVGACNDYIDLKHKYNCAVAAFGNNRLRLEWTLRLLEAGFKVPSIIHSSAIISESATIGKGNLILHGAIINTNVKLGTACLINSGALIDHDCVLNDGVHVNLHTTMRAMCTMQKLERTEAGEIVFSTRRHIEGVDNINLEDALFAFKIGAVAKFVKPFGSGHINDTYAVYVDKNGEEVPRYVIQRINTDVFKKPHDVMENIFGVTQYLRRLILRSGGDADRELLNYLKTSDGENYYVDAEESAWRCYNYIDESECINSVRNPQDFYNSGKSFGNFLYTLKDYPANTLHETIEKFHDTRNRYAQFCRALERDVKNRASLCENEIQFVKNRQEDCHVLMDKLEAGELPLRVTHNDTKINNILFDTKTGKALCVIDLDTIMPGLAANDYGDSIRFGANNSAEDEKDLSKVNFDMHLFEMFTKGYLEAVGGILTEKEKYSLTLGAKIITLECGIRFLTDYLQGDVYFKIQDPMQNLYRARTQFKLVQDMELCFEQMNDIVQKYANT